LTAMDMQCDMNQMSVGSVEKLNVLAGSSGMSEFERDLQQLFPIIGAMNEKQGMSPVGHNFDDTDISNVDLEECLFEVKIEVIKPKENKFVKQQNSNFSQSPGQNTENNNNYDQTNIKTSISASTHATYTTIPASPSLSSVTSKENINYLGSTPKSIEKEKKDGTKQILFKNEKLAADDPFANINPLDGVDPSKLPKKKKVPMQAKKLPKKTKLVTLFQDERIRVKVQIDGDDFTLKLQNLTESVLSKVDLKLDEPFPINRSIPKVAGKKQKSVVAQIQSAKLNSSSIYSGTLSIGSDVQSFNSKVYVL